MGRITDVTAPTLNLRWPFPLRLPVHLLEVATMSYEMILIQTPVSSNCSS
jgi:hypothetical protein